MVWKYILTSQRELLPDQNSLTIFTKVHHIFYEFKGFPSINPLRLS